MPNQSLPRTFVFCSFELIIVKSKFTYITINEKSTSSTNDNKNNSTLLKVQTEIVKVKDTLISVKDWLLTEIDF